MTTAYWIGQFAAVALCYAFVMFLWPLVVFHNILKGKSRTFCFGFCTCGMVLFINLAVLAIGLIPHALHGWLVCLLFYGIFVFSVWRQIRRERKRRAGDAVLHLIGRTIGWRSFLLAVLKAVSGALRLLGRKVRRFFQGHGAEYAVLLFLCAYAVVYFGWGAVDLRTYGTSDMYVHHYWIYGLQEGNIFVAGIYPEGMHTFIYLMNCISGIRVYNFLLFLAGIQSAVLIVSIWLFLRQMFHWKYSAVFAVLLFLILEQNFTNDIYAMSRIAWTVPEEFALYTEFLCGAFLVRFLKDRGQNIRHVLCLTTIGIRNKKFRIPVFNDNVRNPDLLVFSLAIAASFATHFYVTLMAAILCAAIVFSKFIDFWQSGRWKGIIFSAVLAVMVPLIPMALAFAQGHPLQGSLTWALEVMQGSQSDSGAEESNTETEAAEVSEAQSTAKEITSSGQESTVGDTSVAADEEIHISTGTLLRSAALAIFQNGFTNVYGQKKGRIFAIVTITMLLVSVVYKLLSRLAGIIFRIHLPVDFMDGAMAVSLGALFFILDSTAKAVGLPQLIDGTRVLTSARIELLAACISLPDCTLGALCEKIERRSPLITEIAGPVLTAGLFAVVILTGEYHGNLYYAQTRYTEAAETTNRIISQMGRNTYTIVSTTDELYQVNLFGYHEELLTLVKTVESNRNYTLPTEYIFVFVEKRPLQYAQTHFCTGPSWLAVKGKNRKLFESYHIACSQSPDTVSGVISEKEAEKELTYSIGDSHAGTHLDSRIIMESKAMRWINAFKKYYPHDIRTYYEDDNFVCYEIRQDPQIPYRLSVLVGTND